MEIQLKFNWKFNKKFIGNPVEIQLKIQLIILMKYKWKSIGNPVEISMKYHLNLNKLQIEIY